MKIVKNSSLVILLISCFFLSVSCGQSPKKDKVLKSKKDLTALDKYINAFEKEGIYGSFLLMENEKVLFEKSIGFANKEKEIKSNRNTIYPYGSIVKDYTRTVILLLATDGLLSLEDPLSKFYKDIPNDKKNITIAQLLQHRSGLLAYHDNIPELKKKYKGIPADLYPGTKKEALGYIFNQKLKFDPGTKGSYSNSGYTLLAYLIEDITHKKFDEVVREKIFTPAKMTSADFYQSPLWNPEDVAVGYNGRWKYGKENSAYYWPRNPNQLIGNGGMAGSLLDLYKGLRYMMSLEETNQEFGKLSKKYKNAEGMPEDIVGSAGGGELGNIAVVFGVKSKKQYLIFASNNDSDGSEDIDMLRRILIYGFDFDLASIAPNEFEETEGKEETEKTKLSKNKENKSKWELPNIPKYNRVGKLLDFLSESIDEKSFLEKYCSLSSQNKIKKALKKWSFPNTIEMTRIEAYGTDFKISIRDTVTKEKYNFDVKLKQNLKFSSIKLQ